MLALAVTSQQPWVVYEGENGPGRGKHIVFLAGDEEYRSEEGLPQLAKILATRHGFKCTVLFSINDKGEIDPTITTNQPGLENLAKADLCVMLLRFRCWPDSQMKHFVDYYLSGKPIIGLRTSTHAFNYPGDSVSLYRKFHWQSKEWPGGFGKQVLGETWISHWGYHGKQATRTQRRGTLHPVLQSVEEVFCTSDVYEAAPPPDARVLARGNVVEGMEKGDPLATGKKKTVGGTEQSLNEPAMPVLWERIHLNEAGTRNQIVTTTMGAATDLLDENLRRLLVNAAFWTLKLPVPGRADVGLVGEYKPTAFGFGGYKKGVKPSDL